MASFCRHNMRKISLIPFLISCVVTVLLAQRPINIDSLRLKHATLEKAKPSFGNDTLKFLVLQEIALHYQVTSDSGQIYSEKLLQYAKKIKWQKGIAQAYINLASIDLSTNHSQNIAYLQKVITIGQQLKDNELIGDAYQLFGVIYEIKGNHKMALLYYQKSYTAIKNSKDVFMVANTLNLIANSWASLGDKKKAIKYFEEELAFSRKNNVALTEAFALSNIAETLKDSLGQKERIIALIKESNKIFEKLNRPMYIAEGEASIGQTYLKNKEYSKALPYLLTGWRAYQKYKWPHGINDTHLDKNLYQTYKGLNKPAQALFHLENYYVLLDSALGSELKSNRDILKIEEEKKQQIIQINNLKIKQLAKEQQLQKRANLFLWFALALLSILGAGLLWYTRKLRVKNTVLAEKNEIITAVTQKIQTTEIAALRAQMNPHFIFNCLNSIEYFTANNQPDKASEYLSKFSRLIRLVLENSRSEKVSLENEIDTLKLYMDLEAMRFKGKIKYQINKSQSIDIEGIEIPPLLIQPFVENAIWHGLMHTDEGGLITINLDILAENKLKIEIIDNGIGREKAAEYKSKSATKNKSFGMKVTAERIALINQLYKTNTKIEIFDLKNAQSMATGTKVVVEIPI
jgi:tetratricopeptide (TPR) repeat protein